MSNKDGNFVFFFYESGKGCRPQKGVTCQLFVAAGR